MKPSTANTNALLLRAYPSFCLAPFVCGSPSRLHRIFLSVQGDVKFAEVLEKMGATLTWEANAMTVSRDMKTPLTGVDVDCGEIPDAAMTLAVRWGGSTAAAAAAVCGGCCCW